MKIVRLEAAFCPLQVPSPYRIGAAEIRTRDYVLLRLLTEDGIEGFGIGYAGGAMAHKALAAIAPDVVGQDSGARRRLVNHIESRRVPARAALQRALSLLDIALWDVACKRAGVPLFRFLGELRRSVPCMAVAGFRRSTRTRQESLDELRQLLQQGIRLAKVPLDAQAVRASLDFASDASQCMEEGGGALAIDMQWAWRSLEPALHMCSRLDALGLRFIEDPFLPQQWRLAADLGLRLRTPLACGEDIGDAFSHRELCEAVAISRVDATTCGGITGALACMNVAEAFGRSVIPHVFPAIHSQLACANPMVTAVEYIPESAEVDPVKLLLRDLPTIAAGEMLPSERPGVGVHPDWQAVLTHAAELNALDISDL